MKIEDKSGNQLLEKEKELKEKWGKAIYQIMENSLHICTTRDMGEMFIQNLGNQERDRGIRRLLSMEKFKGLTEKQMIPKFLAIVTTYLNRLEKDKKIESLDTHTFLRKVYFLKEFREQVIPYTLHKIQDSKSHPIIPTVMKYFSDHDMASYPDLAYFLSISNVPFNRDGLRSAVKILEDMEYLKRTGFEDDPNMIIIHRPYLSMDTLRKKLRELNEQVLGERKRASDLGREFERKIEEILLKRGLKSDCISFNFKNLTETKRIEFDRVFKINIDPFGIGNRIIYCIVESKAGSVYTVTREDVRKFISKIRKLDQLNVIPILFSRRKLGIKVQEVCDEFGILTYTRGDL